DESNDVCSNKEVCIMIRYFHQILKVVKTDLLSMLTCNTANADNLFSAINSVFVAHHIPWENVISFSSDSASVMIGKNNSVLSWIKQQSNSVYSLPCVFHISHLAAKDAVKAIPKPVEDLLVDIFYYFTGSAKYQQYQQWCDADELQLIKHGGTRWLSLCQAVAGYNNQWEPLKAYFGSSSQIEHPGRVQRINTYMQDEEMHLYFLFLEHGLDDLITYNMFFQAEDSRVVYLWEESVKLLKTLLNQFVKSDVLSGTSDVTMVNFQDLTNQKENKKLSIGIKAKLFIAANTDIDNSTLNKFYGGGQILDLYKMGTQEKRYPALSKLIATLLILPHDQASVECVFSIMRRNKTAFRSRMSNNLLSAGLVTKTNGPDCYKLKPSKQLLEMAKQAT
uniref:HAT C-terminal dimerisation domain-containing protein n=1 Tax=Latimeria chalumnae TaxID=7897 RepID=H2ZYZ5_LATCH